MARHCEEPNGRRSSPEVSIKRAGLLRGACHRASYFGPDSWARNDAVLPAHALRAGVAQRSGGDQPIGHPDRNFGPADAPGGACAVPPDPAPAVLKAHQRVIGARRGTSERDCQHGKSKGQSFHRQSPYAPSRMDVVRSAAIPPSLPRKRGRVREGANQAAAARLPKRCRFAFCFSLRGGSLKSRAAVPPRMLCLPFSDRNGRSQIVDGRSKSQCG
jgi:hypothetical protein